MLFARGRGSPVLQITAKPQAPMFDFDKLDKIIHEKSRLGIMTLLAARASWTFQDLKSELDLSDGNLVTHLRTLHENGYVAVTKEVLDRPQTSYSLTAKGRNLFQEYLSILEQIVKLGRPGGDSKDS
jgi:DNA-binding HxlR family transcriptional regulator